MLAELKSTRACYRFIDPDVTEPEVVTVYRHSDGYPDEAVCWITKALEHAWPLPCFEADEFAAAFAVGLATWGNPVRC